MKKRKMFYLLSTGLLAFTLASCSGKDYKAKNFSYNEPKKSSSATIKYETKESKEELLKFYEDRNKSLEKDDEEEFFNKYKSIMATYSKKHSYNEDSIKKQTCWEVKSIIVPETGNHYYYEHNIRKYDGKVVDEISIETSTSVSSGEVTIVTDIKMVDFMFDLTYDVDDFGFYNDVHYTKKATGSLKLTTKCADNFNYYQSYFLSTAMSKTMSLLNSDLDYADNNLSLTVYTNKDKSYSYTYLENNSDEDSYKGKAVYVCEDYLLKQSWSYSSDNDSEIISNMKYDYIKDNILSGNVNTNGYTPIELESSPFIYQQPFTVTPYYLGGISGCIEDVRNLLSKDSTITSTLTVTEIDN